MRTLNKLDIILFLFFSIVYILSCSEDSPTKILELKKGVVFSSSQIPGCNNNNLLLAKQSSYDSCFAYNFIDTLKVDFCIFGNCCPDSSRFTTNYSINADTIFVFVADTSKDLCDCICNYTIHLEIFGLEKEKYVIYCDYKDRLKYREEIYK